LTGITSRGFLENDVAPGAAAMVVVRMRAPVSPGVYALSFDMVCEDVCWFANVGSRPEITQLTVR
jgi:hypothetical protein